MTLDINYMGRAEKFLLLRALFKVQRKFVIVKSLYRRTRLANFFESRCTFPPLKSVVGQIGCKPSLYYTVLFFVPTL